MLQCHGALGVALFAKVRYEAQPEARDGRVVVPRKALDAGEDLQSGSQSGRCRPVSDKAQTIWRDCVRRART